MIRLQVAKMKIQHNLLSPFIDINALYATNSIVMLIIFMIVSMLYKSFYLTKHFQDVTKQGPLLLRRHLPASLLIHRVQTSLQELAPILIWHWIHFCQSRLPDFSNPLKLLHHHVVKRGIVWLDRKHAVSDQQRWWYSRHSVRQCFTLRVSPCRVSDPHLLSQLPFEEIRMDSAKEALEPHCGVCYTHK